MRNHLSSSVRTRPQAAIILLLILLLLAAALSLIPSGMAKPGSAANAASDVVKLYWGSDTNYNPGNFVTGYYTNTFGASWGNKGVINETTMQNQDESAAADPFGRHMRASAWYYLLTLSSGEYTWVTNSKVNLTDFERLKIMWRQTWDDPGIWSLDVSNVKDSSYDNDVVRSITHESKVSPVAVETMDVSDLNGEYYIRVHARRNSGVGDHASTARVYKMWLEPPNCYQVNVSPSPSVGGSTTQSDYVFTPGASATVTAAAAANYEFVNWTDGGSEVSTSSTYTFPVNDNRNLVAHFRLAQRKIYWNGTEYFPIIGGFQDSIIGIILAKREKRADCLWLWAEFIGSGVQVAWSTEQAVDLTGISKVAVEWKNVGVDTDSNESYLVAATNSSDKQEDQTTKLKRTRSFGTRVDRLDVSGINEPRFIRVHARDASQLTLDSSEIYVYKMWLEPVGVNSIAPASAVEGTANVPVTLMGAAFVDGATVRIQNASKTVNATSVVVVSPNKITCTLALTGAPLGKYDVIVRNPNGDEGVLGQGFSITNVCGGGAAIGLSLFGVLMGFLTVTETVRSRRRRRKA